MLVQPHQARLYFATARGHRFLLRDVPLQTGIDEVGREQLAQVVVTSANAFAENRANTNVEEVKRALSTPVQKNEVLGQGEPPLTPPPIIRPNPWALRVGALYGLTMEKTDNWRHGPGVVLGAAHQWPRFRITFGLMGQYLWPDTVTATTLAITSHTSVYRTALGVERTWARIGALGLGLGFGVDRVAVQPGSARSPGVVLRSTDTFLRPALALDAKGTLLQSGVSWSAILGASVYLSRTEYDVLNDGQPQTEYAPLPVQPHVAVEVGWN